MIGGGFGEKGVSSRGTYIRSTSDILPKWKDIRNSYIPPIRDDMRSITGILKLYAIMGGGSTEKITGVQNE